jgi:hypothetical protein
LRARFIPGGSSEHAPPAWEAQQALAMSALQRAGGEPVTYAELREAGVELPATVISELELAGVQIERCHSAVHGRRRVVGVRLAAPVPGPQPEPPTEPGPPPKPEPERAPDAVPGREQVSSAERGRARTAVAARIPSSPRNPIRVYRSSALSALAGHALAWVASLTQRARAARPPSIRTPSLPTPSIRMPSLPTPSVRMLAPAALVAAAVIVTVLVLTGGSGGSVHRRHLVAARTRPASHAGSSTRGGTHSAHTVTPPTASTPTATTSTTTPSVPPTPVSGALATQLESQGHTLLQNGQYAGAVPVLRRALAATGEQTGSCLQPSSTACFTYAYALYDLGRALRLSGDSAAAVPILESRLQIDNQRPVVAAELQAARAQAG